MTYATVPRGDEIIDSRPSRHTRVRTVTGARIRVTVADPDPLALESIADAIAADSTLELVATVGQASQVVETVASEEPDILLLAEFPSPVSSSVLAAQTHNRVPHTSIVMCCLPGSQHDLVAAMRAGVVGFVTKSVRMVGLGRALQSVFRFGAAPLSSMLARDLVDEVRSLQKATTNTLTPREQEVLSLIRRGLTNGEMAEILGISVATIKTHVHHIMAKLRCRTRVQLAVTSAH